MQGSVGLDRAHRLPMYPTLQLHPLDVQEPWPEQAEAASALQGGAELDGVGVRDREGEEVRDTLGDAERLMEGVRVDDGVREEVRLREAERDGEGVLVCDLEVEEVGDPGGGRDWDSDGVIVRDRVAEVDGELDGGRDWDGVREVDGERVGVGVVEGLRGPHRNSPAVYMPPPAAIQVQVS